MDNHNMKITKTLTDLLNALVYEPLKGGKRRKGIRKANEHFNIQRQEMKEDLLLCPTAGPPAHSETYAQVVKDMGSQASPCAAHSRS